VPIDIDGAFALTSHQLGLYQRCPRRFLYTHLIEVGGRRTETAFMKMHAAVQHVVDWMTADIAATPGHAEIEARLTAVWDTHGPATMDIPRNTSALRFVSSPILPKPAPGSNGRRLRSCA